MKNIIFIASLFLLCTSSAFSSNETIDVDNFLRTVDLTKIIYTDRPVNLDAQMSNPNASTMNVDEMSDFLALGTKSKGTIKTWIAEFDSQSNVLSRKEYLSPLVWCGSFYSKSNTGT
jgi:hypothetical protein